MASHNVPNERTGLLRAGTDATISTKGSKPDPMEITPATRRLILTGLWIGTFIGAMSTTLVATLMSSIASEYEAANQAAWLGTAFLLATCSFTPLYGRLCTVLGRKGAQQAALILTAAGTLACGLSPSMNMLIAARFFTGLGGGGLFTTTGIITSDMYSMRDRSLTQGIAAVVNGMGLGLGGPLGGWINDRFGWRYAFLLQLPFLVLSFIITTMYLNYATPGSSKSRIFVIRRIDFAGVLTLLISVGSGLLFLSAKFNETYPWSHPYVVSSLVVLALSLCAFIYVELYISPEPVMPPFLLRQKTPVLVSISNVLVAICNFSVTYYFPIFFESVLLESAATAGAHVAPNSVAMSLGSLFAGWMMHRTGKYKVLNVVFGIFPTIAAFSIAFLHIGSPEWLQWVAIIPLGFGNSVVLQTTLIALLASVDKPSMAVAMGFAQLFRGLGQVSGVAISSAIFQTVLRSELVKRLKDPELIERVRRSSEIVRHLPPELQTPVRDSYAMALKIVFITAGCFTFAAYLVRLPIPELSMDDDGKDTEDTDDDSDAENETERPTPRTVTPSEVDSEEASGRAHISVAPIAVPTRPVFGRRLSAYQNTPLDVERGRPARKLRNSVPATSI